MREFLTLADCLANRATITPAEYERYTGMPHNTVARMIRDGELKSVFFRSRRMIPVTELRKYVEMVGEAVAA